MFTPSDFMWRPTRAAAASTSAMVIVAVISRPEEALDVAGKPLHVASFFVSHYEERRRVEPVRGRDRAANSVGTAAPKRSTPPIPVLNTGARGRSWPSSAGMTTSCAARRATGPLLMNVLGCTGCGHWRCSRRDPRRARPQSRACSRSEHVRGATSDRGTGHHGWQEHGEPSRTLPAHSSGGT